MNVIDKIKLYRSYIQQFVLILVYGRLKIFVQSMCAVICTSNHFIIGVVKQQYEL